MSFTSSSLIWCTILRNTMAAKKKLNNISQKLKLYGYEVKYMETAVKNGKLHSHWVKSISQIHQQSNLDTFLLHKWLHSYWCVKTICVEAFTKCSLTQIWMSACESIQCSTCRVASMITVYISCSISTYWSWRYGALFLASKDHKSMPSNQKPKQLGYRYTHQQLQITKYHLSKILLFWVINVLLVLRSFKASWHCSLTLAVSSFLCW